MTARGASRVAAVAGATGLVGSALVDVLLSDEAFESVIVLARRPFEHAAHPRLDARVIDFDRLEDLTTPATDAFCALGTTMKRAGSREAFRKVDHEYVLAFARSVHATVQRMAVISALGASASSRVFYNRVKAETEADVGQLGIASCGFFRPSFLAGTRTEARFGERFGIAMTRALGVLPIAAIRRVQPIEACDVATAMVAWTHRALPGITVLESTAIQQLADETRAGRAVRDREAGETPGG